MRFWNYDKTPSRNSAAKYYNSNYDNFRENGSTTTE
jgi:hypothetical protein